MATQKTLRLKNPLNTLQQAKIYQSTGLLIGDNQNNQQKKTQANDQPSKYSNSSVKIFAKNRLHKDINWLMKAYPKCFNRKNPKPLKREIFKDIVLGELWPHSKKRLRQTLGYYTRSPLYQKAILQESHRYSLEGVSIQEIRDHEKEYAIELLNITERDKNLDSSE